MTPPKKSDAGNRPNRIRFIMLDADISDGNLSELTQAITSALKPTSAHIRPLPARITASPAAAVSADPTPLEDVEEVVETVVEDFTNGDVTEPKAPKQKPKFPLPNYLHDLDMTGSGASFKQYAEANASKKHMKRYLISALWLREHGNCPTINIHKVYTCYKTANWPVGINDWDATFRQAVKRNLLRRVSTGEYAITPLGEDALKKGEE